MRYLQSYHWLSPIPQPRFVEAWGLLNLHPISIPLSDSGPFIILQRTISEDLLIFWRYLLLDMVVVLPTPGSRDP